MDSSSGKTFLSTANSSSSSSSENTTTQSSPEEFAETRVRQRDEKPGSSFDNALAFLEKVRDTFTDQPWVYEELLGLLRSLKLGHVDQEEVERRAKSLFAGHPELLYAFSAFIPSSSSSEAINVLLSNAPDTASKQTADDFIHKVRMNTLQDPKLYEDFMAILNSHSEGRMSMSEAHRRAALLFQGDQDLLNEFMEWLPKKGRGNKAPKPNP